MDQQLNNQDVQDLTASVFFRKASFKKEGKQVIATLIFTNVVKSVSLNNL